jgi:hypothetical protein
MYLLVNYLITVCVKFTVNISESIQREKVYIIFRQIWQMKTKCYLNQTISLGSNSSEQFFGYMNESKSMKYKPN